MTDIQVGDKVRVIPVEGVVEEIVGFVVKLQGKWYTADKIEVIEKNVITFKPGDVVKSKLSGFCYTVGVGGFLSHNRGFRWMQDDAPFTSESYELVK